MCRCKYFILFLFIAFGSLTGWSQVSLSAAIDSSSMMMGQQTVVHFHVSQPQDLAVQFPVINDMLAPEVYVVGVTGDTVADGSTITINNDIVITIFEPGNYVIPPFVCHASNKDYVTDSLKIQVRDWPEVFELSKVPGDIKDVYNPPYSRILWIVLIISSVLVVLLGILGFFYWKKHKTDPEPYVRNSAVADSDKPEQTALELIHQLANDKRWLPRGNEKRYFTELTDVLRQYFYRRYSINALEMTSSELVEALKKTDLSPHLREDVREICFTGDMTKFAKHVPSDDECLNCASLAERIVKETMIVPNEKAESAANNQSPTAIKE